ncbi:MAG: cytochrome b/b6 domain-containing protein [Pseudomonadota bacterium]
MSLANTSNSYGTVAKSLHWTTAFLILTLFPLGIIANEMPYDTSEELAAKAWMFSLHKTAGVALFFVAIARILWAVTQPKPGLLHPERKVETLAAETVHWLLYGSLVVVPLSGWIHHAATTGFAPIWWPFGQNLPLVPKSEALAGMTAGAHWVLTKVLALSLVLHIAGALKHHVVDKDATLRRMWFGGGTQPKTRGGHAHALPIATALVLWGVALGGGSALGVYKPHGAVAATAELAEVQSDWQVQDGTLAISVTQLGAQVDGAFADWTAAISFDETVENGVAGTVDVTIAIGSLTLGSVTSQAMGPDYFDTQSFPTATFSADILPDVDGTYNAQGTLTIRDQSLPVTLPFNLSVQGDEAVMLGSLPLDRRDFNIGDNMADESSLAFGVDVRIELTAVRGAPGV